MSTQNKIQYYKEKSKSKRGLFLSYLPGISEPTAIKGSDISTNMYLMHPSTELYN